MSEQLDNLLRGYGVTTERELVLAIQREYAGETGEEVTIADAEVILDGMLEAEYQRIAGGAYDGARGWWGEGEYPTADVVYDARGGAASEYEWHGED